MFLARIRNLFPQRIERQSMKMETQEAISHIFAFFYNAIGVPVAAGAFYPLLGLRLSPMIAAAAMTVSSVSVMTNALRLRSITL